MLPPHELDSFLLTVEEAVELAREGNAADGYGALLAGLHRAGEAEADGGLGDGPRGQRAPMLFAARLSSRREVA